MYRDRYWTSKQYITRELIKNNRVLYVEGNYSFGKMYMGLFDAKWPKTILGKFREEEKNLYIFTPPPRIPLRNYFTSFSKIHQKILIRSLRKRIKNLNFNNPIVWSFLHHTNYCVGEFSEDLYIYHVVDDWPRLFTIVNQGKAAQISRDENDLIGKADMCFTTAEALYHRVKKLNRKTYYVPNAVDLSLFSRALFPETKIPLDIATIKSPVIGFVGSLEKWVAIDWLHEIFSQRPEWQFVSIGVTGNGENIRRLGKLSNVKFLGLKPKEALPGYLRKIDVALIPFVISDLGKSISPLKLFEYFAAGKPVVASKLPEIENFSKYLWVAANSKEFINGIEEALIQKDDPDFIKSLTDQAAQNSWEERLKTYENSIIQVKEEK